MFLTLSILRPSEAGIKRDSVIDSNSLGNGLMSLVIEFSMAQKSHVYACGFGVSL